MDDVQAIRCLKQGDIGGLEILVRRYQLKAVRTAFFVTHDEPLAEDVVQETFLHLYFYIDRFDETRPLEPYLMRAVVNAALNAVRKENRQTNVEDTQAYEVLLSQAASVETEVEFGQIKREVLDALFELPPRQRAAIVQRYYLEMSERDMAAALDAAPGTVKWLLNIARTQLRRRLDPKGRVK
jgi:RNA polymerase sigma-70 factor, ECF subfamily